MALKEWGVTFDPSIKKEGLPAPKFSESMWWREYPEGADMVGQRAVINAEIWEFTMAGFQGSDQAGYAQLHQEGARDGKHDGEQEDVFFLSGEGTMVRWDGLDCALSVTTDTQLKQIVTREEVGRAKFQLAVASYLPDWRKADEEELEHLVLNVEVDGKTIPIEPISTLKEHFHATKLNGESLYFVVKRKRVSE